MININNGRKLAFTLAEVLLTLGIIGLVAAITIPALMQRYQKSQTITQLKSFYSDMQQCLKLSQIDNEEFANWTSDLLTRQSGKERNRYFYEKYLQPYLKGTIFCDGLGSKNQCTPSKIYNLNGTETTNLLTDNDVAFLSPQGYSVFFWVSGTAGSASMYIDTNGPKKGPNTVGKDVFAFGLWLSNSTKGFYAQGEYQNLSREDMMKSNSSSSCLKDRTGTYCSGLIIKDGWQFASDYPW